MQAYSQDLRERVLRRWIAGVVRPRSLGDSK